MVCDWHNLFSSFLLLSAQGSLMSAVTGSSKEKSDDLKLHCRHAISVNLYWEALISSSLPVNVFAYFYPLFVSLCLSLSFSLSPSTYTNTNKHSCHSGLLLRASESLQMGTAKCRCHSASVPKKQGHLLWSQVTTGHLHTHMHRPTHIN